MGWDGSFAGMIANGRKTGLALVEMKFRSAGIVVMGVTSAPCTSPTRITWRQTVSRVLRETNGQQPMGGRMSNYKSRAVLLKGDVLLNFNFYHCLHHAIFIPNPTPVLELHHSHRISTRKDSKRELKPLA